LAAELPVASISLSAFSVADDLGFVAMNDLWASIALLGQTNDVRLIGGYMVTLHVIRRNLGKDLYRESLDIDLGVPYAIAKGTALVESLIAKGYEREGGNRFLKPVTDIPVHIQAGAELQHAAIDILIVPATSNARDNVRVGEHLTATEVPGLADALNRPGIRLELRLRRLNGDVLTPSVTLADEVSAMILKAYSWRKTGRGTDAIDIWRVLEVAYAAGVAPLDFASGTGPYAVKVIREAFAMRNGLAMQRLAAARGLGPAAADQLYTRIKALIQRVLPA
jgi:hypothetical protein